MQKFRAKGKKLYFGFVDLEKAFDRVPREVIRFAMRELGVEEWLVLAVMSMYTCFVSSCTSYGPYYCRTTDTPAYLSHLIQDYQPGWTLQFSNRLLLLVPRMLLSLSAFSFIAPSV